MALTQPIPIQTGRTSRPVLSEAQARLFTELAKARGRAEPGQNCAFNQTRECFVGLQVVAGDFPLAGLKNWLSTLSPNSGTGVWMMPFRGIVANDVTAPLDLLYLDEDCRVLDAVEFFPTFRVSASSPTATSVLALPSHSIFASQTQRGDRIRVCSLEEMEWHLEQLGPSAASYPGPASDFARPSFTGPSASPTNRPVLIRDEAKRPAGPMLVRDEPCPSAAVVAPPPELPPMAFPAAAPAAVVAAPQSYPVPAPGGIPAQKQRGWLSRFLNPEPEDPRRKAPRKLVQGLAAHFFTGGAPHPHDVRDISPTGLYVVTDERWYPGTVIRMTLTRQEGGEHPSERSLTVHAQSMRWGNDGVGLEFVFEARKSTRGPAGTVDKEQLAEFMKRLN